MERHVAFIAAVSIPGLCACDGKFAEDSANKITALERKVGQLEKRLQSQQVQLDQQKLADQIANYSIEHISNQAAYVDSSTKEFSVGRNEFGPYTASVTKLEPFLDGYKLTLRIGNLSDATFTGPSIKIGWGPYGLGHSQDIKVPNDFLAGRFNEYEVALTSKSRRPQNVEHQRKLSGRKAAASIAMNKCVRRGPAPACWNPLQRPAFSAR
jgi:hypothetical protein